MDQVWILVRYLKDEEEEEGNHRTGRISVYYTERSDIEIDWNRGHYLWNDSITCSTLFNSYNSDPNLRVRKIKIMR